MRRAMGVVALYLASFAACTETPTMESLAGSYEATTFTVREGTGPTQDVLATGGFINVTLTAAGTTSGRVFVPGGGETGGDFDADLSGTWTLNGTVVTFDHAADTFVRDLPFTADGGRLTGEATFSGATVRVVLERQ